MGLQSIDKLIRIKVYIYMIVQVIGSKWEFKTSLGLKRWTTSAFRQPFLFGVPSTDKAKNCETNRLDAVQILDLLRLNYVQICFLFF